MSAEVRSHPELAEGGVGWRSLGLRHLARYNTIYRYTQKQSLLFWLKFYI